MLTYWRSATLNAGAAEMASILNRGRQLAIAQNGSVCVQVSGTSVRFRTVSCAGTIWTGIGTTSAGLISLSNGLQISNGSERDFHQRGGRQPSQAYTVTDPKTSRTRIVQVTTTGRVIVQ